MSTPSAPVLRAVLLGHGSDAQFAELERSLIEHEDTALALREAEYDLIDDYAGERLAAAERLAVELRILCGTDAANRLRVARRLRAEKEARNLADLKAVAATARHRRGAERKRAVEIASGPGPRQRWPQVSLAALGISAAAIVLALAAVRIVATAPKTPPAAAAAQRAVVTTIALARDLSDPVDGSVFQIPRGTTQVVLELDTGAAANGAGYAVTIARDARELIAFHGLRAYQLGAANYVEPRVPVAIFAPGEPGAAQTVDVRVAAEGGADDARTWRMRVEFAP